MRERWTMIPGARTTILAAMLTILAAGVPEARGQEPLPTPQTSGSSTTTSGATPDSAERPPRPGERVRVTIADGPGGRIAGRLRESGDGMLRIVPGDREEPVTVRLADVRTLEVRRGGASGIPIAVGTAAGFTWGLVSAIETTSRPCDESAFLGELCSLNDLAWLGVPFGAGLGALVGWGVGEIFFPARWRSVDPGAMRIELAVLPSLGSGTSGGRTRGIEPGLTVGATLRF